MEGYEIWWATPYFSTDTRLRQDLDDSYRCEKEHPYKTSH